MVNYKLVRRLRKELTPATACRIAHKHAWEASQAAPSHLVHQLRSPSAKATAEGFQSKQCVAGQP